MRELTLQEYDQVAGGLYQQYTYVPPDGDPPPPPPPPPGPPPALTPPPMGLAPVWESVLTDLQTFFDDMGSAVSTPAGNDQNSYYDDGEDTAPMDGFFLDMFGWMPSVQAMPGAHYWDYLTQDIDPEFMMAAYGPGGFNAEFGGNGSVAVQALSDHTTFQFTLNGISVFGTWHPGAPTTTEDNGTDNPTIVVTGGYWSFQYTGFDAGYYGGNPPPAPAPVLYAPQVDPLTAVQDPGTPANAEVKVLAAKVHDFLDKHGGHYDVAYVGPDKQLHTFPLEAYAALLDYYYINVTDANMNTVSGGVGAAHLDANGNWMTDFNKTGLIGYEVGVFQNLDFIILHEIAHGLGFSIDYKNSEYTSFIHSGGTDQAWKGTNGMDGAAGFFRVESLANNIARAVEQLIGINVRPPAPGGGFDYSGHF